MPAAIDADAIVELVLERATAADPAAGRGSRQRRSPDARPKLPRLIARSAPPQRLVAVAASERALAPLADAARRTGWRVSAASPDAMDPLADDRRCCSTRRSTPCSSVRVSRPARRAPLARARSPRSSPPPPAAARS